MIREKPQVLNGSGGFAAWRTFSFLNRRGKTASGAAFAEGRVIQRGRASQTSDQSAVGADQERRRA